MLLKTNNDNDIIKGLRNGSADAQRALFDKYSEVLFSTCLRYVGSHADAQDVLQESFIRIFKYFKNFDADKGSLKNWMIRICINEALKKIKAKKEFVALDQIASEPEAEPIALSQLQMDDLMEEIRNLPLPYRTVLNLFLVEGYTHAEISEMLNIKPSSSRSILTRAKVMMREVLNKKKLESWI